MIRLNCTSCQTLLDVDQQYAGQWVTCSQCSGSIQVPAAESAFVAEMVPVAELSPGSSLMSAVDPPSDLPPLPRPSFWSYFGALVGAGLIGGIAAIFWGIVAPFIGFVGPIFAWAVGGLFGLFAGLFAGRKSFAYCTTATFCGLLCMLFGKLISALVVMICVSWLSMMQNMQGLLITDNVVTMGVCEDLLDEEAFSDEEKEIAENRVEGFFTNQPEMAESDPAWDYDVDTAVSVKISQRLNTLSAEDREKILERSREKHPDWFEDVDLAHAVLDHLVAEKLLDSKELHKHGVKKLAAELEEERDYAYEAGLDSDVKKKLDADLNQAIAEKSRTLTEEQQEEIRRACMKNHPTWTPNQGEHLVVLEKMLEEDAIPEHLKKLARQQIKEELDYDYANVGVEEDYDKILKLQAELEKLVNIERSKMSQEEVDSLIRSAKQAHPFYPFDEVEDFGGQTNIAFGNLENTKANFGSDGTFLGSFLSRFNWLDLLWFLLGLVSCLAIVSSIGKNRNRKLAADF